MRQRTRELVLRFAYGLLIFSLCGLYLLSHPVSPGPAEICVGDQYVISLQPAMALSDSPETGRLVGNYTGHAWPGNVPDGELARIAIAADNPRLFVMRICSHEVRHWELEQQGVPAVNHHSVMVEDGTKYVYPWNWKLACFRIIPSILY